MEKFKSLMSTKTGECIRIKETKAKDLVNSGDWHYTSKNKYRAYIRNYNKPHYTAGIFGSSMKVKSNKGELDEDNNRKNHNRNGKTVKSRLRFMQIINKISYKIIKRSIFARTHIGVRSNKRVDPILNTSITSKQGKAIVDKTREVYSKGDVIKKTSYIGIKHKKYPVKHKKYPVKEN